MAQYSIMAGNAPAEVFCAGGVVTNYGPSTVFYGATQWVTASVNDGSIASGATATLGGAQFFVVSSSRAALGVAAPAASTVSSSGIVNVQTFGAVGDGVTDDLAAINSAVASVAALGGEVFFPPGTYAVSAMVTVPGGVLLRGTSMDHATPLGAGDPAPARGSIIQARSGFAPSTDAVVRLGDDATSTLSGKTGASIEKMCVDAAFRTHTALRTFGRRNNIRDCQIWRGTTYACDMQGQNGYLLDSVLGLKTLPAAAGYVIRVTNQDNKIYRCQVREGASGQILLDAAGETEISHNHMFGGSYTGGVIPRHDIHLTNSCSGTRITDNTIEGTIGHHICYTCVAAATTDRLIVAHNNFYQPGAGWPDQTYDVVAVDFSAGSAPILRRVIVTGNIIASPASGAYRSLVNKIGTGTLEQVSVTDNHATNLVKGGLCRNFRPDWAQGNSTRYFDGSTTAIYRTDATGKTSFNGTGAQTAFVIPHGLDVTTPTVVNVTPGHTDCKGDFFVTADATNITVTYGTAPISGTNNVVLHWRAQI